MSKDCVITRVAHVSAENQANAVEELYRRYPNTFSGKLGCLKGVEITLDIEPEIKPVRQAQRPVAVHLRDSVERELANLVCDDVMERVDQTSGPTPWVANLVVVPKGKRPINAKCGSPSLGAGA